MVDTILKISRFTTRKHNGVEVIERRWVFQEISDRLTPTKSVFSCTEQELDQHYKQPYGEVRLAYKVPPKHRIKFSRHMLYAYY